MAFLNEYIGITEILKAILLVFSLQLTELALGRFQKGRINGKNIQSFFLVKFILKKKLCNPNQLIVSS